MLDTMLAQHRRRRTQLGRRHRFTRTLVKRPVLHQTIPGRDNAAAGRPGARRVARAEGPAMGTGPARGSGPTAGTRRQVAVMVPD
jgi:hypothetical protein